MAPPCLATAPHETKQHTLAAGYSVPDRGQQEHDQDKQHRATDYGKEDQTEAHAEGGEK